MCPGNHRGVHAHADRVTTVAVGTALRDREQLDDAVHLLGTCDISRTDVVDAFAVDVGGSDPGVKGEPGEDGRLGYRVEPVDVCGRVGLGVAECLCLLQRFFEAGAGLVHLGQDVVGRAVDDADDPGDTVTGKRLTQRSQQRDRARDTRLAVEISAATAGHVVKRRPVLGEQCLVGRDHTCAALERCDYQGARRLDASDDLHDEVDVRSCDEVGGVGREQGRVYWQIAHAGGTAYGDAGDVNRCTDPLRQLIAMDVQHPDNFGADNATAQDGDLEWCGLGHDTSRAKRSSNDSRRTSTQLCPSPTATTGG